MNRFFALGDEREALFERLRAVENEDVDAETRTQIHDLIRQILETDREIKAEILERSDATRQEIASSNPA